MLDIKGKSGRLEEPDKGSFWRGTAIDIDTRLRVGRAIGKDEEEVAMEMMSQIRYHGNPVEPQAIASDGNDSYPEQCLRPGEGCLNILAEDDYQLANNHSLGGNASK